MSMIRDWLRRLRRRVTTVEPVRDARDGDGPVAPDLMRNIPPGGGGPGV
jgi:hypothetical protein